MSVNTSHRIVLFAPWCTGFLNTRGLIIVKLLPDLFCWSDALKIAKAERSVEKQGKHLRNARKYHDRVRFWLVFLLKMTELANAVNPPSLISCCFIHTYTTVSSDWFWLDKRQSQVLIWSLKAPGPVTLCITPFHRWWWHEWQPQLGSCRCGKAEPVSTSDWSLQYGVQKEKNKKQRRSLEQLSSVTATSAAAGPQRVSFKMNGKHRVFLHCRI